MSKADRVEITRLETGVTGLDEVLGGGLPEYSFTLIAGDPGTGKTTLASQIMFNLATSERPALYFTVMGESMLKMLRYQQQMDYFDASKVGTTIRFVSLNASIVNQNLEEVLAYIVQQVEETNPGLVVFDSFHNISHLARRSEEGGMIIEGFLQRLALYLAGWQATTFLLGAYREEELHSNSIFTVADSIIWLSQVTDYNSIVRKMQVIKIRGQEMMPGLHTLHLTGAGLQVYPRINADWKRTDRQLREGRAGTGVPGLDDLLGGGIPLGDAILLSGSSGTGKSVLATQFIAEGIRNGEPGVIAIFEEHPREYMRRASSLGIDMEDMQARGMLDVIYLRPLDLSPDETFMAISASVQRIGAQRVALDSVAGFEMALASNFRQDFRESLYRLVGTLTGNGSTVLITMEIEQHTDELRFSPYLISFLSEDIILLRHIVIEGQLRKSMAIIKMRNSDHSKDLWLYDITSKGMVMRQRLGDPTGTGAATAKLTYDKEQMAYYTGLNRQEIMVVAALLELREASQEELGRRTSLEGKELSAALDRVVDLSYATRDENRKKQTIYRPTAHTRL